MWRALAVIAALMLAAPVHAANGKWVEVTGYGAISGKGDEDSARRRALADALFNAALAGGADVRGHTAVSMAVVRSDLSIVRVMGRVFEHRVVAQGRSGDMWQVTIQARVGEGGDAFCQSPRRLVISAYAPQIRVSPHAPHWAEELAYRVVRELIEQLDRHPATDMVRITDRPLPGSGGNDAMDYTVLTQGSVRMGDGEMGFVPVLNIDSAGGGFGGKGVRLEAEMLLYTNGGATTRQSFVREVSLGQSPMLGRLGELTRRDRDTMAKKLTEGLRENFDLLLSTKACDPVTAVMAASGGKLTVPVGKKQGLTKAALAFTAGRSSSSELLEIVSLSQNSATLRPLDPNQSASSLDGQEVRFVEAAW